MGGVDYQAKAFQGMDPKELKAMTPAERREATATDMVHSAASAGMKYFNGNYDHWAVDFAAVAAGFFSTSLPEVVQHDIKKIETAIAMVENFLRYIEYHNVCPEYNSSIKKALEVCSQARYEYPLWLRLQSTLPGNFNIAALRLFAEDQGNSHSELVDQNYFDLPSDFDPKVTFYSAITLMDDHELLAPMLAKLPPITRVVDCTLLVKDIYRPSEKLIEQFEDLVLDESETSAGVSPVGKVIFTPIKRVRDGFDHPIMPEPFPRDTIVTLYFDDQVLQNLVPGMKMEVRIVEIENGFNFVQRIIASYLTFHVFLPQEMMRHFHEIKDNDRPAPSIHTKDEEGPAEMEMDK